MVHCAIILAGGFGTRLQTVVSDLPKPMAPVCGKPFLYYMLRYLKTAGLREVILCTGHLAEKIEDHFGGQFEGMPLRYSRETEPLGTGGAVRDAFLLTADEEALVLNGDSFFDLPLYEFYQKHLRTSRPVSLALRKTENASRYGQISVSDNGRILQFNEKTEQARPGLINAGVYLMQRDIFLNNIPQKKMFSIETEFFQSQCGGIEMNGFEFSGYFIDIGIPADYEKAQLDFKGFKY